MIIPLNNYYYTKIDKLIKLLNILIETNIIIQKLNNMVSKG